MMHIWPFGRCVNRTNKVEEPDVKWQTVQLDCRDVYSIIIDLACLAFTREGGCNSFHGGLVIAQVNNLLVEPRVPLMLIAVSCMNFFMHSGHFFTYNAPKMCLVETSLEEKAFFHKNLEGFICSSSCQNNWLAILDTVGNPDRVFSNLQLLE